MLETSVLGVSVWGPGLEGWAAARPVLAGEAPYVARNSVAPAPAILAATERRRAGPVVRLALAVAQEAAEASGVAPGLLRPVFGSSNGDGVVVGSILDTLARGAPGERVVSPTQFHNSVHNAAAGYWSIAHGSRMPATCLGAHDWTWAASLLTAMVEVGAGGGAVLLVCYDHPLPAPLDALRPTRFPLGVGLVLAAAGAGPRLRVGWRDQVVARERGGEVSAMPGELEALRTGNAIGAALPLLAGLALGGAGRFWVPYLDGGLAVELA